MASSRVLCGYCIEVNVDPRRSSGPAFAQADLAHYNWCSLWPMHGEHIRPPRRRVYDDTADSANSTRDGTPPYCACTWGMRWPADYQGHPPIGAPHCPTVQGWRYGGRDYPCPPSRKECGSVRRHQLFTWIINRRSSRRLRPTVWRRCGQPSVWRSMTGDLPPSLKTRRPDDSATRPTPLCGTLHR